MTIIPTDHVLVDVTAAQAGQPPIQVQFHDGHLSVAEALVLGDDLRRAALTAAQIHTEYGASRDPRQVALTLAEGETPIVFTDDDEGEPF